MQGSWYTAGQILQQLEKATRCRTSAPDRTERPCKTYHLSNSNKYILNSVKSTFHTFPFEKFKVYSLRNYFSIFILSLVSLWLWIDILTFTFRLWVWMKCLELSARGGQSKHQKKTRRSLGPCLMSRTVMMTPGKWDHLHSLSSPDRGLRWHYKTPKGVSLPNRVYSLWRYHYDKKIKMFDSVSIYIYI